MWRVITTSSLPVSPRPLVPVNSALGPFHRAFVCELIDMEKDKPQPTGQAAKASTSDVLGVPVGQSNVDPRWEKQYRALTKARDALLRQQDDLLGQAAEEVTPAQVNMADVGTDQYDRDWALSMASSAQETLYEIEQALNRIRNGTYGVCEATGRPIEPERLQAIPWTRFSAEAERRLEAEGQAPRARLGPREEIKRESTVRAPEEP